MSETKSENVEEQGGLKETTKEVTKPMVAITPELANALLAYLQAKPYTEVVNLISALSQSQTFNATIRE